LLNHKIIAKSKKISKIVQIQALLPCPMELCEIHARLAATRSGALEHGPPRGSAQTNARRTKGYPEQRAGDYNHV
jgi:hypothetical protein